MTFLTIPPAIIIILILAILYGTLFHLWKGKTWRDLGAFILIALIGFIIGQLIGVFLQLDVLKLGQVHIIEGTLFAWLLMLAFVWLKG
jgi:hypothetical protein